MNTGIRNDIVISQGAPFYAEAPAYVSGNLLNLSGCSGFGGLKYKYGNTGYYPFTIGIVSAVSGIFSYSLSSGHNLNVGQPYYEIAFTGAGFIVAKQYFGLADVYPQVITWI